MSTAIKVENLTKAYQLGTIGTGTLSRDLERWIARVRGKEDPFMTIGEANDRSVKGTSDVVLSLSDVSFDIKEGEAVGIIGRNGAGKSTLLKLLSRVTSPTSGSIKVKGRIASLLEVGTGFHPELTGRENIFLNGAILGMRKKEIARKFDQIVDFAGIERYIDTPVKRYSSGMYVRLAFAVAAHLESEILIVDEVLAVGDAEFQKKCLGKMGEVSKGEGRTVLFVSHNMGNISQLCTSGVMLKFGKLHSIGKIQNVIDDYLADGTNSISTENRRTFLPNYSKSGGHLLDFNVTNTNEENTVKEVFSHVEDIIVNLKFLINQFVPGMQVGVGLQNRNLNRVCTFVKAIENITKDRLELKLTIPGEILAPGNYSFVIALWNRNKSVYDLHEQIGNVHIVDIGSDLSLYEGDDYGSVIINGKWDLVTI